MLKTNLSTLFSRGCRNFLYAHKDKVRPFRSVVSVDHITILTWFKGSYMVSILSMKSLQIHNLINLLCHISSFDSIYEISMRSRIITNSFTIYSVQQQKLESLESNFTWTHENILKYLLSHSVTDTYEDVLVNFTRSNKHNKQQ